MRVYSVRWMTNTMKRLKGMKLPSFLKSKYLLTGLFIGALWGLLSTATFVIVGMFGNESHPYHWLFQVFQNSVHNAWFRTVFLPFSLSMEAGFVFAFFGSTLVGAAIGVGVVAVTSASIYMIRKVT